MLCLRHRCMAPLSTSCDAPAFDRGLSGIVMLPACSSRPTRCEVREALEGKKSGPYRRIS